MIAFALLGLPPIALPDRVFVSYSRKNESFARRIELDLQDAGLKVWFDRFKIRGGDEWRQSIQRGIDRADFVVFCLSPDSVASEVCHWELNTAQQSGKLIIPIMFMDCLPLLSEPSQQPIAWLKERHILDFTQADEYGRRFKELLAALPGYNPPDSYYEDTLDTRQIPNPFRGLEAFRELDYHYFAGASRRWRILRSACRARPNRVCWLSSVKWQRQIVAGTGGIIANAT